MLWKDKKIVVEYDSNLTHLTSTQHSYDKKRATALSLSGYTVISITIDNLRNLQCIDESFIGIRKALGLRKQSDRLDKYKEQRGKNIKEILLSV